jgi:hypothetical protein
MTLATDLNLAWLEEDRLARAGFACVSRATLRIVERIEASPSSVSLDDYAIVLYEIFSGAYGLYHQALAFDD